jgi:leader peptidase (prepilin peptidase)/N-methyltransferase
MDHLPNYFFGGSIFFFGLIIGSFLNVVISRVPERKSIVYPGSRCPSCGSDIKPYDNIPVLSYLLLRGRCRNCQIGISIVYPLVELAVACLFLVFFLIEGLSLRLLADLIFISLTVPLVFIDFRHKILPNVITYPGFIVAIVLRLLVPDPFIVNSTRAIFGLRQSPEWLVGLLGSMVGAAVGAGILWLIRFLYFRLRQVEGMGLGDLKMMLMVGAFLGWQLALMTIFLASLGGSVVGSLILLTRKGNLKMELPFGVFLGPGSLVALGVGERLIAWYMALYR